MSEERLQEIKDSVEFQYAIVKAKNVDNALLFTNEEEELIEEIERLNNIIDKAIEYIEETLNSMWIDERECLKEVANILQGSDKE